MEKKNLLRACISVLLVLTASFAFAADLFISKQDRVEKREAALQELQKEFHWWPTDARPAPVKDPEMGGYWWIPTEPGTATPWGNRGYVYVYKIIYDYKSD